MISDDPYLGLLADVLRALAGEETLGDLLQGCAEAVVTRLDAAFTRIWLHEPESDTLVLKASAGQYTHLDGPHGRIPVGSFKIGRIAAERRPHLTNSVLDDPDVSDKEWARQQGMVAFAGYPLQTGPRLVGVLGLFCRHELHPSTLEALASVADSLALGILRKQAEEELRQDRQVIDALHGVGTALARELDVQRVVQAVTDAGTELSGARYGAFFYNVVDEHGEGYLLYTLSGAPKSAFEKLGLPRNTPVFGPTFAGEAPIRSPDITKDPRYGHNPPFSGMPAGHLPVRSYLAVPVISREGEVLGGLFFGHPEADVFTEASERLVVGIAGHAAISIENARLYQQARTAAITLQRSLLPRSLPPVEGAILTAAYRPASHHAEIGGDWYDALTLPDGCLSIVVGDVGGHDLTAAAVMGQLRNTVRLSAVDADGAVDALRRTERYWTLVGGGNFATVLYAGYDPASRTLSLASAGHPPPLLIGPDGVIEVLAVDPLPALGSGLFDPEVGEELKIDLVPGSKVVMFTDGLLERRDRSWEESIAALVTATAARAHLDPSELSESLIDEMIGDEHQADDVALLILTVT